MRTLITGATGLVGRELVSRLGETVVLTRDVARARRALGEVEAHAWVPERGLPPAGALREVEVVFNLAGEPIAEGRWSEDKKLRIRDSRVLGTHNLVAGLAALDRRPGVLVSASAIGFYGDRGDAELDESAAGSSDFLGGVCADWEGEAMAAEKLGVRVVCVRFGVVLSPRGGALARMLPPFRLGMGGQIGNGQQWMSWIHLDDVVGILLHASANETIHGPLNAVSPAPVTNAEFTRALGQALHRPTFVRVPRTALRLAFGEMSQVLTDSQRVLPKAAERTGYAFKYPDLGGALVALISGLTGT
jgi:uncharacterized protein (TIGR01777 family)